MRTELHTRNVDTFVRETDHQRLRDLYSEIKEYFNIRNRRGSYKDLFHSLLEDGYRIVFEFDENESPDCDGEIHADFVIIKDGETRVLSRRNYMHCCIHHLPKFQQYVNTETKPNKESNKMKKVTEKAKQLGTGTMAANKTAFGMAAQLQGGRVSNKAVKEAVRPLIKLMFKPSFMQRLLAKVFKRENPIDTFIDSPYGSLFASNMAQLALDIKGVPEDSKARLVVIGGIAHAYNELGDLIPVEKTIDEVVKKLTEAADKVVS